MYYEYDEMGNLQLVLPATVSSNSYVSVENSASVDYAFDDANRLSSITTDSTVYTFTYDSFGNSTSISAGDYTLASYTYNPNNGKLSTLTYGNGLVVRYSYDVLDRVEKIEYNIGTNKAFVTVYSYAYDSLGNLARVEDHTNDTVTEYKYDLEGRLAKSYTYDAETYRTQNGTSYGYDDQSRLTSLYHTFDYAVSSTNAAGRVQYTYAYDDAHKKVTAKVYAHGLSGTMESQADMYGSADSKKIDIRDKFYNHVWYDYHCTDDGDATIESTLVSTYTSTAGLISNGTTTTTFHYVYDDNGNITQIKNASGVIQYQYTYDDLGQLIREDNRPLNKSYTWTYDNAGNRLTQKTYAFTTGTLGTATYTSNYSYTDSEWGDLCTSMFDDFDAIGNPTSYGVAYLSWQGRELVEYYDWEDSFSYTYTYNDEGIRTSKNIRGVLHEYILNGSQIIAEKWENNLLIYIYDEAGSPIGLMYRNSTYASGVYDSFFFEKNLQGDVIAVYDATGTKIGSYTYDAWGNFTTTVTSGNTTLENNIVRYYNPFRYRSYFYDTETGWYYLQSRYYVPSLGRFLNADGQLNGGLLGYNLFAYCDNNPVNRIDYTGEAWWHWALAGAVVVACLAATVVTCGGSLAGAGMAIGMVASGSAALTTASTVAAAATIGSGMILGGMALNAAMNTSSLEEFAEAGNWGTVVSTVLGGMSGGAYGYNAYNSQFPNNKGGGFNLDGSKNENYINKRGWSTDSINKAINNGKMGSSINKANGASCSVYCYPNTKSYVVIEDESRSLVQASQFGNAEWIPDSNIVWGP